MNFDSDGPAFGVEVIMALSLICSLNVYFPFFDVLDADILVILNGQGTAILLYL